MIVPAHQRIRDELVTEIESGSLSPGERRDGENHHAARGGVTRMTVRQALTAMVNDGLLVRRQGVGTFVAENAAQLRNMTRLTGFTEDMAQEGRRLVTQILVQQIVPASAVVARALGLSAGDHVTHVARLRVVDGSPLTCQYSWVPFDLCRELWQEPLVQASLYATLRIRFGVELRRADQRVAAEAATEERARLLEIPIGTPLLRIERVVRDARNVPVEFARSWMRPGFEITTHIER
jgi:GntR family transcriptional regulator